MKDNQYILHSYDVLNLDEDGAATIPYQTILNEDLLKVFGGYIQNYLVTKANLDDDFAHNITSKWFKEGVPCDLLAPEKHWKKGRVKLVLVFESDEAELEEMQEVENKQPESLLDDIRQSIQSQKNSENEA